MQPFGRDASTPEARVPRRCRLSTNVPHRVRALAASLSPPPKGGKVRPALPPTDASCTRRVCFLGRRHSPLTRHLAAVTCLLVFTAARDAAAQTAPDQTPPPAPAPTTP